MSAINWHEEFDDNDNSYWEGQSPYTSEPDAPPDIYWRLRQRLFGNRIEWYEDHDAELMAAPPPDSWLSLDAAKAAIQEAHDQIIDEYTPEPA